MSKKDDLIIIPRDNKKNFPSSMQITKVNNKIEKTEMDKKIIDLQEKLIEKNNIDAINNVNILNNYQEHLRDLIDNPKIKMFYNNKFHKIKIKNIIQYEQLLNSLLPPLAFVSVSYVAKQYLSVHHEAGTEIIMQFFMPYYLYSIDYYRDSRGVLQASTLTRIFPEFPFIKLQTSSAVGKTDNIAGGEQGRMTYAEKLSNNFGFLRTVYYKLTLINKENLENLINNVKKLEINLVGVDSAYRQIFNYCIDYIAHYYIQQGIAPKKNRFTFEILMTFFNMDELKKLGIFYTDKEIEENQDLIIFNDSPLGNTMERINSIINSKKDLIKDEIDDSQEDIYYYNNSSVLKTNALEPVNAGSKHLIPRDYFTVRDILHNYIEELIDKKILPRGTNISPNEEELIKRNRSKDKSNGFKRNN